MTKTYATKTQATKAKKFGQQVYQRKDKSWAIRWPKNRKVGISTANEMAIGHNQ